MFDKKLYAKEYAKNNPQKVKDWANKSYQKNKEAVSGRCKERYQNKRYTCLAIYSEGIPRCSCCGESIVEFLSIDHIEGGGNKLRKVQGGSGGFYNWLIKNGFPEGFRVLCFNCNSSIGFYGYCPHSMEELEAILKDLTQ
jgi:hypothetical protein